MTIKDDDELDLVGRLLAATAGDLASIDTRIEELEVEIRTAVADKEKQIDSLRVLRRAINMRLNGAPQRGPRKKRVMPDQDADEDEPVRELPQRREEAEDRPVDRLIQFIIDEGPSYPSIIVNRTGMSNQQIAALVRHHPTKLTITGGMVHVVKTSRLSVTFPPTQAVPGSP